MVQGKEASQQMMGSRADYCCGDLGLNSAETLWRTHLRNVPVGGDGAEVCVSTSGLFPGPSTSLHFRCALGK